MKTRNLLIPILLLGLAPATYAVPVRVAMNAVSTTMTLATKDEGTAIATGEPVNKIYDFDAPAGEYLLTAYATDGKTVNGTIAISVPEGTDLAEFKIITNTAYVTNKYEDGTAWTVDNGDYTLDITVNSREGERYEVTCGKSTTAGRNTFLALNGNSYNLAFVPSEAHQAEGYTTLYKGGTLTFNVNLSGAIPLGEDYSITVPADAELQIGLKFFHFIDFTEIEPKSVTAEGGTKTYTYYLSQGQVYNYRTWKPGGLTQGGYFTMSANPAERPQLGFAEADYSAFDPHKVNHDPQSNEGYETGDILVNINERGHLSMNVGETFTAHAMRMWELTDNSTNNYFIEPDFHYTVVGLDGRPLDGVVEISQKPGSAWADIEAVGTGTAIVLVNYDAIGLNFYSKADKKAYMGGEYWGAIWPENTGVYVVSVGEGTASVEPNMTINSDYNNGALKLAGKNVDAEHDVFYYLDTEPGALYTFSPEGAVSVTMASPVVGERSTSFAGFSTEGVTDNGDGSYTLLLRHGRQIVRLTDASGRSAYQVLTARKCRREIVNASRPGSNIFQPGDKVKIQYSGLFHPANKIAGIYNMSAYVTYNGVPNGSSLILGSGQYTFGSAASAQAVTVDIPADHDVAAVPEIVMDKGVIQVNGYGDPIGNHRTISPLAGRSPNFTAVPHKTYFGSIPDVAIKLTAYMEFPIRLDCDTEDAKIEVTFDGKALEPGEDGLYAGTYGTYSVVASKPGYRCFRGTFDISDDAEGLQTFVVAMEQSADAWDGKTIAKPAQEDGVYLIAKASELAWLADHVNVGNASAPARMVNDIDLGNYDWTPIGTASKPYSASFDGAGHTVDGLYINKPAAMYQALFGYLKDGSVNGVEVRGSVTAKQHLAGVVAYVHQNSTVSRCANHAAVSGSGTNVGGVTGYLATATSKVADCYNTGSVTGTTNVGGVSSGNVKDAVVSNVYNIGEISGNTVGACIGGTADKPNVTNAFCVKEYQITAGQTLVSEDEMRSGRVAWLLGDAFGQEIGTDAYPLLGGKKVLYDAAADTYYNEGGTSGIGNIDAGAGLDGAVYYNLQGVSSPVPFKGFNIVRLADGSVRKMIAR